MPYTTRVATRAAGPAAACVLLAGAEAARADSIYFLDLAPSTAAAGTTDSDADDAGASAGTGAEDDATGLVLADAMSAGADGPLYGGGTALLGSGPFGFPGGGTFGVAPSFASTGTGQTFDDGLNAAHDIAPVATPLPAAVWGGLALFGLVGGRGLLARRESSRRTTVR